MTSTRWNTFRVASNWLSLETYTKIVIQPVFVVVIKVHEDYFREMMVSNNENGATVYEKKVDQNAYSLWRRRFIKEINIRGRCFAGSSDQHSMMGVWAFERVPVTSRDITAAYPLTLRLKRIWFGWIKGKLDLIDTWNQKSYKNDIQYCDIFKTCRIKHDWSGQNLKVLKVYQVLRQWSSYRVLIPKACVPDVIKRLHESILEDSLMWTYWTDVE